ENRERFAHPVPRIDEAAWLSAHGATAAIDISDGLAAELGHLAAASRISITVRLEDVPVVDGMSPIDAAASGEEDELIIAAPSEMDASEFSKGFGVGLPLIGRAAEGPASVVMTKDGEPVALPAGYLHFIE